MLKRKDLSKGPARSVGVYRFLLLVSGVWGLWGGPNRKEGSFFLLFIFLWCS